MAAPCIGLDSEPDRLDLHLLLILSEKDQELRKEGSVAFGHRE